MKKEDNNALLEKIVSLAKRRGFIYQGSEIYGGLAGMWDYGPLGVALKKNIETLWWKMFVEDKERIYGIDAAILMNEKVWQATGHVDEFSDPMVECTKCKKRFRADQIRDEYFKNNPDILHDTLTEDIESVNRDIKSFNINCSTCKGEFGEVKKFNMMFKTHVGATEESGSVSYLRPETAQGIFVNFKNIIDSFHPKLPFGIAQIGKAFRNEITPRDFIFRVRELEQMEVEYFVDPSEWEKHFEMWRETMHDWIELIGLKKENVHEREVEESDRAHYSKRTIDFEYDFPFGRKELYGLAYRTDYDLRRHMEASKVNLEFFDEATKKKFIPHVIEPSLGLERTVLALLLDAYTEDTMGDEVRVFLKFKPAIAPMKVAVFPLLKNKPQLVEKAREVWSDIKKEIPQTMFDDNGNIGKRYRRQDEIGTPLCVTIDFDTLEDDTVTVRDRDTGEQERIAVGDLSAYLADKLT